MTLSWHQQRAAGMHRMPYDIVGYTFNADNYCPDCIRGNAFLHAEKSDATTEALLDIAADAASINRADESSFDGSEFPMVLLRDMLADPLVYDDGSGREQYERCGHCGAILDA